MSAWFYIREFLEDLKAQKTRAFLTTSAITWGTLAVTLLLAFGEGLRVRLVSGLLNAGDRIVIIYGGQTTKSYQGLPEGRRIRLTEEDVQVLKEFLPEIEFISAHYGQWNMQLRYGKNSANTYGVGVEPPFEIMRRMYPVEHSRFLDERDQREKRRVIFLGFEIAKDLFGDEDPVGKILYVDEVPFKVIGVMQKKLQTSMNNGPDTRRAVMPASTFRTLYGRRYVSQIVVRPRDVSETPLLKREIQYILGRQHRFDPADSRALPMWDFVEEAKEVQKIFLGMEIFLGVVGGLTLLVAGVGVANIMFVIVKERTREIGIKMAVGARKRHILGQFIFEALFMAFLGGVVGLLISAAIVKLFRAIPMGGEAMQYLGHPTLSTPIMLVTVLTLTAIGLLAGVFPARRATRVDPVESLRYE